MGSCFSIQTTPVDLFTAEVISVDGTLWKYSGNVAVSQVLHNLSSSHFLCNADNLYFDQYIPALSSQEKLRTGQIYFLLPNSMLKYPLSAQDMAAMAVKASVALEGKKEKRGRRKKLRVSPVMEVNWEGYGHFDGCNKDEKVVGGLSRSGSVRKLQRHASRRAKMAIRSFRLTLSTIYEGRVAE